MPTQPKSNRRLNAAVGTAAAALLLQFLPMVEGTVLRGYLDPIGIVSACTGHTKTAILGRPYTPEECSDLLEQDALEADSTVERCVTVPLSNGQRAALISFAFNVGPGREGVKDGLCVLKDGRQPQIRQRFNRGDYAGGCHALIEGWMTAGGKFLRGLERRRKMEREICEDSTL